ncbi:uroporphyrinogen-III C-methyltransferase [Herbaspirillum lusitanum]|jgi:uroporphyrin-3 C-methyltransferase/uroporphyrinogen III methyltransferase/synthase|uniref:Uroporphyrinogen-III C-methyltransferase n=1 Tax=Herbaspirillum lusitanum TaxID=213312 RepID=A0ABW9A6M1_9BURK
MNEQQLPPDSSRPDVKSDTGLTPSAPFTPFSQIPDGTSVLRRKLRVLWLLLILVIVALAAQWWMSRTELQSLRTEVAQRLQSGDNNSNEVKGVLKLVQESTKELQAKVSVLDNKQAESQSQQLALEQMYQDLNKNRDDWALSEIEEVLSTASQQLELAGNVQGALIALQNADRSLSRSDKPQFIAIRRAIARDMDRLKALPTVDVPGISVRLDSVIGQIDSMPLLVDEKPVTSASEPKPQRVQTATKPVKAAANGKPAAAAETSSAWNDWLAGAQDTWQSFSNEMWTELKQLVRIRDVRTPDALLLSPAQSYFVRENLKLRLLNARLALLSRNEFAFRNDLSAAQDSIAKYFDTRAKQVQTTQALLKQVQGSNLSIQMPSLSESLNAVRNYKARR